MLNRCKIQLAHFTIYKIKRKTIDLSTNLQGINPTKALPSTTTTTTVHFSQRKCQIHMCSRECVARENGGD